MKHLLSRNIYFYIAQLRFDDIKQLLDETQWNIEIYQRGIDHYYWLLVIQNVFPSLSASNLTGNLFS